MCARFSLTAPPELLARFFGLMGHLELLPRYNVAPTQPSLVVLRSGAPPQGDLFGPATPREVHGFAIVTTTANDLMAPIHDRMPVVVALEDFDRWLDPRTQRDELDGLLRPPAVDLFEATEVCNHVNRVRSEGPQCWQEVGDP